MHKKYVKNISKIDSGKSFRKKPDSVGDGGCWLIQMKDVAPEGWVQEPQSISLDEVNDNQLLNTGDLIFVAKGSYNYALVYDRERPAAAVSLFFIIRPDHKVVDPWYLAWCINSKNGQQHFDKFRSGSSVGNIRKSALENLEVVLPDLETQNNIAKLFKLTIKERKLTTAYMDKRDALVNASISKSLI